MELAGCCIEGLVFLSFAEWLTIEKREKELAGLEGTVHKETFELLRSADKSRKYPITHLSDLFDACREKLAFGNERWEAFGVHLCKVSLHTRFGGLASYLDPETFITRVPLFWWRYFEGSNMDVDDVTARSAFLRLREPAGVDELTPLFTGWLKEAMRMMDATGVEVDALDYTWRLSWEWTED